MKSSIEGWNNYTMFKASQDLPLYERYCIVKVEAVSREASFLLISFK